MLLYTSRSRGGWRRGPAPVATAKKRVNVRYENELVKLKQIEGVRKETEARLESLQGPIRAWNALRNRKNEAIRRAQIRKLSPRAQLAAADSITGRVTYEEYMEVRKQTDKIRQNLHNLRVQEEVVRSKMEALRPVEVKDGPGWGAKFIGFLICAAVALTVLAALFG